jgi:predicted transcriptional regulator
MGRATAKSPDEDFHVRVPSDLRTAFEAAAEKADRPTGQVIIDLMRDFVDEQRRPDAGYDEWFRAQIQASLDDQRPNIPHDEVMQKTLSIIDSIAADKNGS